VPGDSKLDNNGAFYLSSPTQHVIYRSDKALNSALTIYAGKNKVAGNRNGDLTEALFAGPTALAIDNSAQGGIYLTDTLNHSIRKIGLNKQIYTVIGSGSPGTNLFNEEGELSFDRTLLNGPRGLVAENGGNLYLADTDNHAIYYIDFVHKQVILLAGKPGESGKEDGPGQQARFKRPSGMALSSDGRVLTVADEDNNRVRLIQLTRKDNGQLAANVSTLGVASSTKGAEMTQMWALDQSIDEIVFNRPQSVSFDGSGNIYVVGQSGVKVVTRPFGDKPEVVELAQPDISFNQAESVVVKGTEVFVLDAGASTESEAIKVVTVGAPEISTVTPDTLRMEGGPIVITGKNFAPESVITFGDKVVKDAFVVSATEIRLSAPPQSAPGLSTLSILTRGGLAQREFNIIAKPVLELAVGEITTIAGGRFFTGDGGAARVASLSQPGQVIVDSTGNLFIADSLAERVRRVDAQTGIITTVAGGGTSLKDGELATLAHVKPNSIRLDGAGNLFIVDLLTNSIRSVDAVTNTISTVAGAVSGPVSGDGGPAINASLGGINDIAFDQVGNLYISSIATIRRVDAATGIINTIAGNGSRVFNGDNISALSAGLSISSMVCDSAGNLFIADSVNRRVRRIDTSGIITTVAGNGTSGSGKIDGKPATDVGFFNISNVTVDANNNLLLIADGICRVDLQTGIIKKVPVTDPDIDGFASNAGLAVDSTGNIYFSSLNRILLRPVDNEKTIIVAGTLTTNLRGDGGPAVKASIGYAEEAVCDKKGNIFIADSRNSLVRRVEARTGIITTVAGSEPHLVFFPGQGDGKIATSPEVAFFPSSIEIDNRGNLYILDSQDNRIRRVDAKTGIISTVAGNSSDKISGDGGQATKAGLGQPFNLAFGANGNLFVSVVNRIRRIDIGTGIIKIIAGNGERITSGDGGSASGAGMSPRALAVDKAGNIFLVDNGRIRRIDAKTGTINTVAGNGQDKFNGEGGPAKDAGLGQISSVAIDAAGNLYIGAFEVEQLNSVTIPFRFNSRIWRVDAQSGILTLLVENLDDAYSGDGGQVSEASLAGVPVVRLDRNGNLLISTTDLNRFSAVRFVKLSSASKF
jgi:sugar lactone lactonase YvrE